MANVQRTAYIEKIRRWYDNEQVKIIVGVRRSGKSMLLRQIIEDLKERGIDDNHILTYNFESLDTAHIKTPRDFDLEVKSKVVDEGKYYLFCDEIQLIDDFERAVNSLRLLENVSIFITGSNSRLFSTELSTLLSGRYISFYVQPFSFAEAIQYTGTTEAGYRDLLDSICHYGSLPLRFDFDDDEDTSSYLIDVFNSIVARDVIGRQGIRNIALFESLFSYMIENIGNLFELKNVVHAYVSAGQKISSETIYEYLHAMTSALLLRKAERYNIAGKSIFQNKAKYYATDLGLSQIKLAKSKRNLGAEVENLVYNELLRRGYEVYVGHLKNGEIDFVAIKYGEIEYYQVCLRLDAVGVSEREFGAFKQVKDNLPKFIISLDPDDHSREGITHYNLIDWLLGKGV